MRASFRSWLCIGFFSALTLAWLAGLLHPGVPIAYAAVSMLSFLFYAHDKAAARGNRRRTPERTLHLLDLAGGWPGALLAQQYLRHKSAKPSFLIVFWLTLLLNCAALAAWLLRDVIGRLGFN